MTDPKTFLEDSHNEERRLKIPHHLPRHSILSIGSRVNSGNHSGVRPRSQSSRSPPYHSKHDRRLLRYENTYRMEPNGNSKLDLARARCLIKNVLELSIAGYNYDADHAKQFSIILAERIRHQLKQLSLLCYKIVTQVSIGQKKGQGLFMTSQCLWDTRWDNYITITKETASAYVTVTVFFIYTE